MLTKAEIRSIAEEAFLTQGNIEDAMAMVEDYFIGNEDAIDDVREYMEEHEEALERMYERFN